MSSCLNSRQYSASAQHNVLIVTSVIFRPQDIDTVISDVHGKDLEMLIDKLSGEININ